MTGALDDVRARSNALLSILAKDPTSTIRAEARAELADLHTPLVHHLARGFQHRGELLEDLVQVGMVGLLKAIDRFEIDRGLEFTTYATPTVIGEVRRHLRDRGCAIRVPRRLHELRAQALAESGRMAQRLGRSPSINELAAALDVPADEIVDALESGKALTTVSLDVAEPDDDSPHPNLLGESDDDFDLVELRESLRPLLDELDERSKKILVLRYFRAMSQADIAEEIGVSQMHVSRLLTKTLDQLRAGLNA